MKETAKISRCGPLKALSAIVSPCFLSGQVEWPMPGLVVRVFDACLPSAMLGEVRWGSTSRKVRLPLVRKTLCVSKMYKEL